MGFCGGAKQANEMIIRAVPQRNSAVLLQGRLSRSSHLWVREGGRDGGCSARAFRAASSCWGVSLG